MEVSMRHLKFFIFLCLTLLGATFAHIHLTADSHWDLDDVFVNLDLKGLIVESSTLDIVYASQGALTFYGYEADVLLTMNLADLSLMTLDQIKDEINYANQINQRYVILKQQLSDGRMRDLQIYVNPFNQDDQAYLYLAMFDITQSLQQQRIISMLQIFLGTTAFLLIGTLTGFMFYLRQDKKAYEYLANHDILTSARSRLYFEQITKDYIIKRIPFEPFAFVMLDIDHFKNVNDLYGHVVGDQVLKYIVSELYKHMPENNKIYRYGGDEFILFIHHLTSLDDIHSYMKELISKLHANAPFEFELIYSYGIEIIRNRQDLREAIKIADTQMYKMKHSNRDL